MKGANSRPYATQGSKMKPTLDSRIEEWVEFFTNHDDPRPSAANLIHITWNKQLGIQLAKFWDGTKLRIRKWSEKLIGNTYSVALHSTMKGQVRIHLLIWVLTLANQFLTVDTFPSCILLYNINPWSSMPAVLECAESRQAINISLMPFDSISMSSHLFLKLFFRLRCLFSSYTLQLLFALVTSPCSFCHHVIVMVAAVVTFQLR